MKNIFMAIIGSVTLIGCVSKNINGVNSIPEEKSKKTERLTDKSSKPPSIVVDTEDMQTLEKMNKAMEAYVLKNDKAPFEKICKDIRFDCFVDERLVPTRKKKIKRTVPPYASGSKMGLQEEERLNIKYNFYP